MAWVGLIRTRYKKLTVRVEETNEPCWCVRLYDGDSPVGEQRAEGPKQAVANAVALARKYLDDGSITVENLDWVQR